MAFNELNSVEHYIIHQLTGVNFRLAWSSSSCSQHAQNAAAVSFDLLQNSRQDAT